MSIYLGNSNEIEDLYFGNTKITKAYLGSTLVYEQFPIYSDNVKERRTWYDSYSISTSHDYRDSHTLYIFNKPYKANKEIRLQYTATNPNTGFYSDRHRELRLYNSSGSTFQSIALTISYNLVTLNFTPTQDCYQMEFYLGGWYRANSWVTISSIVRA